VRLSRGGRGGYGQSKGIIVPQIRRENREQLCLLLRRVAKELDRPIALRSNPFGCKVQWSQRGVVDCSVE
jgi:hypothetical protein